MKLCLLWILLGILTFACVFSESRAAAISLGNWLEWSRWSLCTETVYCMEGSRQRQRQCEKDKRCVGIDEESEGCPSEACVDRPVFHDIAHAGEHSFIQEECSTSVKYHTGGKYSYLLKHNITRMFPHAWSVIDSSYFNVKVTKKKLASEEDIFKYCFEPRIKKTLEEFVSIFATGNLRFKHTSIYCPLPKPREAKHVTGFVIGVQKSGNPYAIYAQITTEKGFKSIHYKHMPGSYTGAYNIIW